MLGPKDMIQSGNLRQLRELVVFGVLIYLMKCYVSLKVQKLKIKREVILVVNFLLTFKIDNKHIYIFSVPKNCTGGVSTDNNIKGKIPGNFISSVVDYYELFLEYE